MWLVLAVLSGWSKSQGSLAGICASRRQHYIKPTLGDLGPLNVVARAI